MPLPTLIELGDVIWGGVLVAFVALVVVIVWTIRWAIARVLADRIAGRLAKADGALVGVLRGGGARTLRVGRHDPMTYSSTSASANWRDNAMWLETTTHGNVALDGDACVLAGTRYAARRRAMPRLSERDLVQVQLQIPKGKVQTAIVATLADGDAVIARGQLEPAASSAESDYRTAEIAWTMRGHDGPLELASQRPVAARLPISVPLAIAVAVGAGLFGWMAERSLGESWLRACRAEIDAPRGQYVPLELSNTDACVLASSMPYTRDRGLDGLQDLLRRHGYRDEATVERLDAVSRLVDSCDRRAARMMRELRYEAALEEARSCGERRIQHEALVALGRYGEAADLAVPGGGYERALPEVSTLIAAGRWREAAERARYRAPNEEGDGIAPMTIRQQCFDQLLRHHAGDVAATRKLEQLSDQHLDCLITFAAISPRERRIDILDSIDTRDRFVDELKFADGTSKPVEVPDGPERVIARPEDATNAALLWLVAITPTDKPQPDRLRWTAAMQVLDREIEKAAKSARAAVAVATTDDLYRPRDVDYLEASVALFTPSTDGVTKLRQFEDHTFGRLLMRTGVAGFADPHIMDDSKHAFIAAQRGEGMPLANYMRQSFVRWTDGDILAVAPRIKVHRDVVASQVRWGAPAIRHTVDPSPVRGALVAFMRRELLEEFGELAEANRWHETYRRHDAVLRDRAKLLALMLWQRL